MTLQRNPSFDEAIPLGAADAQFVADLHDLLKRYGNLNRFGLCLLHDHFDVNDDEILLETNDYEARTLKLEVVKRDALQEIKFTSWRIDGAGAKELTACAEDKCKKIDGLGAKALTGCFEDKCKKIDGLDVKALTACAMDKCKKIDGVLAIKH